MKKNPTKSKKFNPRKEVKFLEKHLLKTENEINRLRDKKININDLERAGLKIDQALHLFGKFKKAVKKKRHFSGVEEQKLKLLINDIDFLWNDVDNIIDQVEEEEEWWSSTHSSDSELDFRRKKKNPKKLKWAAKDPYNPKNYQPWVKKALKQAQKEGNKEGIFSNKHRRLTRAADLLDRWVYQATGLKQRYLQTAYWAVVDMAGPGVWRRKNPKRSKLPKKSTRKKVSKPNKRSKRKKK